MERNCISIFASTSVIYLQTIYLTFRIEKHFVYVQQVAFNVYVYVSSLSVTAQCYGFLIDIIKT